MRNLRVLLCLLPRLERKPNAVGKVVFRAHAIGVLLLACSAATLGQRPELVIQTGHSGWLHTVAFSPDGKIFASGSSDQTIRLWNAATGAELRTLKGHTYSVLSTGHGTAQQQRFYLIPYDLGYQGPRTKLSAAELQTILEHSISDRELEDAFAKIDAWQMLMVIDACNSGQALDSEQKRRGPMNSKGLAQLAYEKGMYILTAAQSYQAAWEASKLGHGYLTYALIEQGLKHNAADDEPKDGAIVLREWLNYATEQVPRMQEEKMKQTPGIKDRQGRELEMVFVEGDENIKDPAKRNIQRPRVFYRREPDVRPLVVAGVGAPR